MARHDALLRLKRTLIARRDELRKLLAGELGYLQTDASGDTADMAFAAYTDEMSSRLAEMDGRELEQIERVLTRLEHGTYGICEGSSANCQHKIPVARLNVLPYATYCINCERELEKTSDWQDQRSKGNWAQVYAFQAPKEDRRIDMSKLEMTLPSSRRG